MVRLRASHFGHVGAVQCKTHANAVIQSLDGRLDRRVLRCAFATDEGVDVPLDELATMQRLDRALVRGEFDLAALDC